MPTDTYKIPNIVLTSESIITLLPLNINVEKDGSAYIGRKDKNSYIHVYGSELDFITHCDGKRSIEEVSKIINVDKNKCISIVFELLQAQFIHKVGNEVLEKMDNEYIWSSQINTKTPLAIKYLSYFVYTFFYLGFIPILLIFFTLSRDSSLLPMAIDKFWHPSLALSVFSAFLIAFLYLAKHEFFHYISAKAFGIPTQMSMSQRLIYLTMETEVEHIFTLKKRKRMIIYLIGLLSDLYVVGFLLLVIYLSQQKYLEVDPLMVKFLKQAVLIGWVNALWELQIFMKTDLYSATSDFFGINKLQFFSITKFKLFIYKLLPAFVSPGKNKQVTKLQTVLNLLPKRKWPLLNIYFLIFFIGTAVTLFRFILYRIPDLYLTLSFSWQDIYGGVLSGNYYAVFEGFLVALLTLGYYIVLYIIVRNKLKRRSDSFK